MKCVRVALLGPVRDEVLDEAVRQARARCVPASGPRRASGNGQAQDAASWPVLGARVVPGRVRDDVAVWGADRARAATGTGDRADARGRATVDAPPGAHGYALLAWVTGRHGAPFAGSVRSDEDEHCVLDVDDRAVAFRPDLADVLQGTRPRSVARSVWMAAELARTHSGCLLAAVPRTDGGWSVAGPGTDVFRVRTVWHRPGAAASLDTGSPTPVPAPLPEAHHPLLPSCLHGWLVAGHELGALHGATVVLRC